MPRVIAGTAGGRPLKAPPGASTRPTADRVKEALFSSLGDMADLAVLDLYAGSGGLGIEALSRGAASAVLVEQDRRAVAVIRANLATAAVAAGAQVMPTPVSSFCRQPVGGPFDLVLLDPPYKVALDQIERDLGALIAADALRDGAQVVLERAARDAEPLPGLLDHRRDRTYGETLLRYFTYRRVTHHSDQPTPEGASPP